MHRPQSPSHPGEDPGDGVLFCGNPHESVPRALFSDDRLTPLERNAWQIIRMQVSRDGVTAFPTYDSLRPYLTSVPCSGRASDETIARALILLRLTRWLSLVRHRRRAADGRILGNLYVLHDEPLAPNEAIQLDPHYLSLVSDALTHASKAVQRVGFHTLKEIASDPMLSGRTLPSRLHILTQRLARQGWSLSPLEEIEPEEQPPSRAATNRDSRSPDSTADTRTPAPPSESEGRHLSHLRNPKEDRTSTVRTDSINRDVRTVPRAREAPVNPTSQWFDRLRPEQQAAALAALQPLTEPLRTAVLEEWAARCASATVRHPARYLFGLIQRALRGQFNTRVPESRTGAALSQMAGSAPEARSERSHPSEPLHDYIETLRNLLRIR